MTPRRYQEWKAAHTAAIELARQCNCDAGIWATKEFGKLGYNVGLLPKPENRYGRDAQAEVVKASDPF